MVFSIYVLEILVQIENAYKKVPFQVILKGIFPLNLLKENRYQILDKVPLVQIMLTIR